MVASPPYQHISVTHNKDWLTQLHEDRLMQANADAAKASARLDAERAETERAKRQAREDAEARKLLERLEKETKKLHEQLEAASNSTEIMNVLHQMQELGAEDFAFKYIQHTSELSPQEKISLLGAHTENQSRITKMLPALLSALPLEDLQFDALMPAISEHSQKAEENFHQQLNALVDLAKKKGKKGPWEVVKKLEPIAREISTSDDLNDVQKIRLSIQSLKVLTKTNENWFKPSSKMRYGSFWGLCDGSRREKFEDVIRTLMSSAAYRPVITVRGISLLA